MILRICLKGHKIVNLGQFAIVHLFIVRIFRAKEKELDIEETSVRKS